jgi:radical SAM superfamily enzyme YgiQ (UPF0313 family)
MKPKVLLINPWIYDFAAANLWSRPLGLLEVAEYLSAYDLDLTFIDCLSTFKPRRYNMGSYPKKVLPRPDVLRGIKRRFGRYGISIDEFFNILRGSGPFDIILVTSIMTYWYPGVTEVIRLCKEVYPDTPIILGGIYATLHEEHASLNSGADYLYKGKINKGIIKEFDKAGFDVKRNGYSKPYYRLGMHGSVNYAPLLTTEGCPYRCSYCASSMLTEKFRFRDKEIIFEDIKALHSMGVKDIAFYDDALLYRPDDHVKKILARVVDSDIRVRFHTPNGLHAKFIDNELAVLMKISGFKTVRLSLETINAKSQTLLSSGKVTSNELSGSVKRLKRAGFSKKELGVYLMYGLPGQGINEVWDSVKSMIGLDVKIHLSEFSPIPGTDLWNELISKGKITGDIDPLLTNNTVYSQLFSDYQIHDIQALKDEVIRHNNSV